MVLRNRASGVVLLLLALAVSGCALSDEGAVDYRRGDIKQAATPGRKDLYPTRALKGKNLKTDLQNAKFSKMDSVSINIQQAFIRDCFDLALNPLRGFRKNCEIAIIANVFEFGNGADFNFSEEGLKDGRIVFYSGDVYPGQFLNFNNLPVYGPIQYSGNPLGIMFAIVEIDAESQQVAAVLKVLASVGSIAYPPAAPELQLLNKVGTAVLGQSGKDDTQFKYAFVLVPDGGHPDVQQATLAVGDYAFIRENDRTKDTNWDELKIDENTGRLVRPDGAYYRGNTYITIKVNKNLSSKDIDLSQNKFGAFRQKLEELDRQRAGQISGAESGIVTALNGLVAERVQIQNFSEAKELLSKLRNARALKQEHQLNAAVIDLGGILHAALQGLKKVPPEPRVMSEEQVSYLIKEIREISEKKDLAVLKKYTVEAMKELDKDAIVNQIIGDLK